MAVHNLDDAQLAAALRSSGQAIAGARRDLSVDVIATLRSTDPGPARWSAPRRRLIPAVIVVAALLASAAVAAGIVPGVTLRIGGADSAPPVAPLVADPEFLGTPTTLAVARDRVDFPVRVPALGWLGRPQVYHADQPSGGRVSLLYAASDRLPAIAGTPVGLFVTQFRGDVREELLTKTVNQAVRVTPVDIGDNRGWWVEGAHEVLYAAPGGEVVAEPSRFADSTLLWTRDGVTLRLESALPQGEAIAIATSVR
jgi:hypothetical protein